MRCAPPVAALDSSCILVLAPPHSCCTLRTRPRRLHHLRKQGLARWRAAECGWRVAAYQRHRGGSALPEACSQHSAPCHGYQSRHDAAGILARASGTFRVAIINRRLGPLRVVHCSDVIIRRALAPRHASHHAQPPKPRPHLCARCPHAERAFELLATTTQLRRLPAACLAHACARGPTANRVASQER